MADFTDHPVYSTRLCEALSYAAGIHMKQVGKSGEPYLNHLLQVCGLVLEAGGDENAAIAALLHDAVEDVGIPFDEIENQWGTTVMAIVFRVTENKDLSPKGRKVDYCDSIRHSNNPGVFLVSAADKLHNLRSYASTGRHLWDAGRSVFLSSLVEIYKSSEMVPGYWITEMETLIKELDHE